MKRPLLLLLLGILTTRGAAADDIQADSYLDALSESHGGAKTIKREGYYADFHPGYPDRPFPYPEQNYGPPKPIYGPPVYPQPQYGPPPPPNYGQPPPFYGVPHALLGGIIDKIKFKLDLLTIGKILLKLVIFKKIVSWIAILCLLLFIPSLKNKAISHDDNFRRSIHVENAVDDRLDNISSFVLESIENFRNASYARNCDSTFCKAEKVSKYLNEMFSYDKLAEFYVTEQVPM